MHNWKILPSISSGQSSQKNKMMQWSTIGWVAGALVKAGVVDSLDFAVGSRKRYHFMRLSISVIPGASFELIRLKTVLQGQEDAIQNMKTRALAVTMSVLIAVAQVGARYLQEMLSSEVSGDAGH